MAKLSLSYPDTGLTISVSIKDRDTGIEDFSGVMTEISKVYKYDFVEVAGIDYIYVATCAGYDDITGVIYAETSSGGLTAEEHTKLFSLENSTGGGGFSINYGAINAHTTNKVNELKEQIDKIPKTDLAKVEEQLNDIDSHITLAFGDTIDTIKKTENYICTDIKTESVATRQLVRQKAKKLDEGVAKLVDSEAKTQKMMDDEFEEIEQALEQVDEEEITKAIEQADSEHEQNIIEALKNL